MSDTNNNNIALDDDEAVDKRLAELAEQLREITPLAKAAGERVKNIKSSKDVDKAALATAVAELKKEKARLASVNAEIKKLTASEVLNVDRELVESVLKRRFFIAPTAEIYGGTAGLFDLGPPGAAVLNNLTDFWRRHFIIYDQMHEIRSTTLTPAPVLVASGHVEKFSDFMVRDTVTNVPHRADKLLEDHMDKMLENNPDATETERSEWRRVRNYADDFDAEELGAKLSQYNVTAPETGNPLSEPFPFNLMFKTAIGPSGKEDGYMRPETAQGMFVNFKRLLDFNGGTVPFAAAQIGTAYRNEIAPRSGLLRLREFDLAEIEHFVNPKDKSHPKFKTVAELCIPLWTKESQQATSRKLLKCSLGEAVEKGVIDNETLAYFMGRTYLFLVEAGLKKDAIRFRQHKDTEKAHYSKDCWDAEALTSYGWVEIVGHADRSAYDLEHHGMAANTNLTARVPLPEPITVVDLKASPVSKICKQKLGKNLGKIMPIISKANPEDLREQLASGSMKITGTDGNEYEITSDMIKFNESKRTIEDEAIVPNVIEPAFGLSRIMYCIYEHTFWVRDADNLSEAKGGESGAAAKKKAKKAKTNLIDKDRRTVLSLPSTVSPYHCSLLPLSNNTELVDATNELSAALSRAGVKAKVDLSSAAIGRRYARTDEIGIPYGITVDFETAKDKSVTLRDRDTTKQVRIKIDDLVDVVCRLAILYTLTWDKVWETFPHQ